MYSWRISSGATLGAVEVRQDVGHARDGLGDERVSLGLQHAFLGDVVLRELRYLQAAAGPQGVEFGRVGGVEHVVDPGQVRLVRAGVLLVRHVVPVAVVLEAGQLPRPVHDFPQRVRGERARLAAFLLQEAPDRLGARRGLVVVADLPGHRGLVPGVLGQQRDVAEHILGVEVRVVGVRQVQHDRVRAGRGHAGHVGGEQPRHVPDPVAVGRLQQVVGEREVPASDWRPVGPLPRLRRRSCRSCRRCSRSSTRTGSPAGSRSTCRRRRRRPAWATSG